MIKLICSFWVITELAAILLLASIVPAQTSPIWECKSGGGWSMKSDGSMTEIPASEDTVILEFQSPNKMRPVKANSAFEQRIYDEMTWEQAKTAARLCHDIAVGRADLKQLNKQSLIWRGRL